MGLNIIVCVIHATAAFFWINALRNRVKGAPLAKFFLPALAYRVAMGWLLGYVFLVYYQQGDTINYFRDARELANVAYQQPEMYLRTLLGEESLPPELVYANQPRALFFVKLVSLVNIITYNDYWLSAAYLSFISFGSSWLLANYLSYQFPQQQTAAVIAFLFYPSVAFWGAGILKESVAVAAIMLITWITWRILTKNFTTRGLIGLLLLLVSAIWLLWQVKYYYAGVLLPTLIAVGVAYVFVTSQRPVAALLTFVGCFLLLISAGGFLHPRLQLPHLAQTLVDNHDTIVQLSENEHIINFSDLKPSCKSLLSNLPRAIASGLFRPLVGEVNTIFGWLVGIENTLLLLLSVDAVVNSWKMRTNYINRLWITAALTYIIILAGLLAFASPNFGSLMRYKVSYLPFLVFLSLAGSRFLSRKEKVNSER